MHVLNLNIKTFLMYIPVPYLIEIICAGHYLVEIRRDIEVVNDSIVICYIDFHAFWGMHIRIINLFIHNGVHMERRHCQQSLRPSVRPHVMFARLSSGAAKLSVNKRPVQDAPFLTDVCTLRKSVSSPIFWQIIDGSLPTISKSNLGNCTISCNNARS